MPVCVRSGLEPQGCFSHHAALKVMSSVCELQEANKPENRAKRPWIITMGHRPMYCSNNDKDDCTKRDGIVSSSMAINITKTRLCNTHIFLNL